MKKALYIFGAGGLGREVLALVRHLDEWEPKGFFDDGLPKGTLVKGLPVLGGMDAVAEIPGLSIVVAIGSPLLKKKIALALPPKVYCPVLIHPSSEIMDPGSVQIGAGSIVCAGAVLTTDILIGDHVLVNLNATVGHDAVIGSYSSLMPGVNVAGEVNIGESVLLGSGSNIRNRVSIGDESQVGMGAAVIRDVQRGETVVGVPAHSRSSGS